MGKSLQTYKLQVVIFWVTTLFLIVANPSTVSELSSNYNQIRIPGNAASVEEAMGIAKPGDLVIIDDASNAKFPIELSVPDITVICNRDLVLLPLDNKFTFSIAADNVDLYFCPISNPNALLVMLQSGVTGGTITFPGHGRAYRNNRNTESPPNDSEVTIRGRQ